MPWIQAVIRFIGIQVEAPRGMDRIIHILVLARLLIGNIPDDRNHESIVVIGFIHQENPDYECCQ
jgi:hypothetical protein